MVPLRAGPSALPLDQATRSAQVQSQYATPLNVTNLRQATNVFVTVHSSFNRYA